MSKLLLGVTQFFGIGTDNMELGPILYHVFTMSFGRFCPAKSA